MDDKIQETVGNICTILGGALLLYPLIDKATKTIIPEMDKLTSGETLKEMKALPPGDEKDEKPEKPDHEKYKPYEDEITELKRKLAEFESKAEKAKSDS